MEVSSRWIAHMSYLNRLFSNTYSQWALTITHAYLENSMETWVFE